MHHQLLKAENKSIDKKETYYLDDSRVLKVNTTQRFKYRASCHSCAHK